MDRRTRGVSHLGAGRPAIKSEASDAPRFRVSLWPTDGTVFSLCPGATFDLAPEATGSLGISPIPQRAKKARPHPAPDSNPKRSSRLRLWVECGEYGAGEREGD